MHARHGGGFIGVTRTIHLAKGSDPAGAIDRVVWVQRSFGML
jgi:hypothetical protein